MYNMQTSMRLGGGRVDEWDYHKPNRCRDNRRKIFASEDRYSVYNNGRIYCGQCISVSEAKLLCVLLCRPFVFQPMEFSILRWCFKCCSSRRRLVKNNQFSRGRNASKSSNRRNTTSKNLLFLRGVGRMVVIA